MSATVLPLCRYNVFIALSEKFNDSAAVFAFNWPDEPI